MAARYAHRWLSALAFWPGVYVGGAAIWLAQLLSIRNPFLPTIAAFCTGIAVFLLDRVKLRDALLDPADALAEPGRVALLCRRPAAVRALAGAMLVAGTAFGVAGVPIGWGPAAVIVAGVTPALGAAGVLLYAGRPRGDRARPKDRLFIKNGFVAAGIVGIAGGLTVAPELAAGYLSLSPTLALAIGSLTIRAFADAALCDLDDAHADLAYATRTLPHVLGREGTRWLAFTLHLASAGALLAGFPHDGDAARLWAWTSIAVGITFRVLPARRLRDTVDAALGMQAAVVVTLVRFW